LQKISPFVGYLAVRLLLLACFLPWVTIESRGIVVDGIDSGVRVLSSPGRGICFSYFFIYFLFLIVPQT
jgi:hypothetical protein